MAYDRPFKDTHANLRAASPTRSAGGARLSSSMSDTVPVAAKMDSAGQQLALRKKLQERKRMVAEAKARAAEAPLQPSELPVSRPQPAPPAGLRLAKARPTTPPQASRAARESSPPPSSDEEDGRRSPGRVSFGPSAGAAGPRASKLRPLPDGRAHPREPRNASNPKGAARSEHAGLPAGLNFVALTAGSVAAAAASTAGSAASAAVSVAGSAASAAGSAASAAAIVTGLDECLPGRLTLRQRTTSTVQRVDMLREAPLFSGVSVARMSQIADT